MSSLAPGSKPVSSDPVALSRPIRWRDVVPEPPAPEHREETADDNLPVCLQGDLADDIIRAGIEGRVYRAVGIEAADVAAGCRAGAAAEPGEFAADQDLPVRLHRQGADGSAAHAGLKLYRASRRG